MMDFGFSDGFFWNFWNERTVGVGEKEGPDPYGSGQSWHSTALVKHI